MNRPDNILVVRLGEEAFGFDAEIIDQILHLPPLTSVPLSDVAFKGIGILSGHVVQVIDPALAIGMDAVDTTRSTARIVTTNYEGVALAFCVDEVVGMVAVDPERFEAAPEEEQYVAAFYKDTDEVVQLLTPQAILQQVQLNPFVPHEVDLPSELQTESSTTTTQEEIRALFFKADEERYAIDIQMLRELIFAPEQITPIAGSDAMGMITLREEVIAILSMNALLGFGPVEIGPKSRALIAMHESKSVALMVEEVDMVRSISQSSIERFDENFGESLVEGVYRDDEGVVTVLSNQAVRALVYRYYIEEHRQGQKSEVVTKEGDVSEIAVFSIEKEEYAFDIEEVQEIIRYSTLTPVPEAPAYVEGILNLRGSVIAVISLAKRLGYTMQITDKSKIIVCTVGDEKIGFIVDDVSEILFVEDRYIAKAASEEALFDEVINLDEGRRVILKISVRHILDEETLEQIKMMEK